MIYTISMFDEKWEYVKTVGYFKDLNEAKDAVINNSCDIYEYSYPHVMIEAIEEGLYPINHAKQRYCYQYDYGKNIYRFVDGEEFFHGLYGFAMG